jgi:iron(III) transport system permease protein
MLPMAVPGLVLGLGYIFFFNEPSNPLNGLYHTMALLTLCTIVHFYTTGPPDGGDRAEGAGRRVRGRVGVAEGAVLQDLLARHAAASALPALIDIARYFFVNAMTTISAVVFLYSPETKVASIAILNLDEAGEMGAAAACAVLITAASTLATLLFWLLARLGRAAHLRPGRPDPTPDRHTMDRDPSC